jgi:hypothetical protein
MTGTFLARIQHLSDAVGHGDLEMKVETDQPYAAVQDRGFWETGPDAGAVIRHHPGGGTAHFARIALFDNADSSLARLAASAITPEGSDLEQEAVRVAGDLADAQSRLTPRRTGRLAASATPVVTSDGVEVYRRSGAPRER